MLAHPTLSSLLHRVQRQLQVWLTNWLRILRFSVLMAGLVISPSTYRRDNRHALARQLVLAASGNLLWFTLMASLVSLVLIRIVMVTSLSYGLSQFALEMVVRVLVIELIPLTAALFVALRVTLPDGLEFAQLRALGALDLQQRPGNDPLRCEFFPRVVAGMFSVWLLAALSCAAALVLAYLVLYGFTPWALAGYTRVVGKVFNPALATILVLKIVLFSFAVALIPLASAYYDGAPAKHSLPKAAHGLTEMVRLFTMILLVEVASLMGNYI